MLVTRQRQWLTAYIAAIAAWIVYLGVKNLRLLDHWSIGDWLINYQAGFVRRGLLGEAALHIAHRLHWAPATIVVICQLACYLLMLCAFRHLVLRSSGAWWVWALTVSPATLAFPLLEPAGGYRKEIVLLAGLALLTIGRGGNRWLIAVETCALGVATVLMHEGLIVFFPYVFAAIALRVGSVRRAASIAFAPALLTGIAWIAALRHPGDEHTAARICQSLGFSVCDGSIGYLVHDRAFGMHEVLDDISRYPHHVVVYAVMTALASIPVALAVRSLRERRELAIVRWSASISVLASGGLFLYGLDWGRWIYIHVFCLALLLLKLDEQTVQPRAAQVWTFRAVAALLLYATCWDVPYIGGYDLGFGLLGQTVSAVAESSHGRSIPTVP